MNKATKCMMSALIAATAMLCSCGNSVDGYNFSGSGVLGSIPEARAKCYEAYHSEAGNMKKLMEKAQDNSNSHAINVSSDDFLKEFEKMQKRIHDKIGDDTRKALVDDMARLESGKDFPLEDKTGMKFGDINIIARVDTADAMGGYITVKLKRNDNSQITPELYYLGKAADGTVTDKGMAHFHSYQNLQFTIGENNAYSLDETLEDNDKYDKQMHYLMSLDSIASIELVDYATYFDYTDMRATTEGVGPVKIGAKISDMPDSCYIYCYKEEIPVNQPDMTVCEFSNKTHTTLFTAIGDSKGKIKSIEVERLPIKLGGKVVKTHLFVRDAVEILKDAAEWSYDSESQNAIASFEGGKVTISFGNQVFNESGWAKYQQLQKGAKGVKFDFNDFNDYDTFETYTIRAK